MRVGFVRNVGLGMVALVGLGVAACDDSPTDFDNTQTVKIFTNPSSLVIPAGRTTLLVSRTENAGNEPTFEEITATIDATCGAGTVAVDVASTFEPSIQPPGRFDVVGGGTLGTTCINLSGGGANAVVEVTVVADSLQLLNAPDSLLLGESVQLSAAVFDAAGTGVGPFDPVGDLTFTSDADSVISVDSNGLVTSTGIGTATITASYTDGGTLVTSSITITTIGPVLAITGLATNPDTLIIFDTVDLSATLTDPPGKTFGPFDPDTDVIWSSSDDDVVTVDEVTGEIEGVAAGTATITAVWTGNATVLATQDVVVVVPAPVIAAVAPGSADAGDLVTLTGTGFIDGGHDLFAGGVAVDALYDFTVVSTTTATFRMPVGANGDVSFTVGVTGNVSNAVTVTRTNADSTEPANDADATAPVRTLPLEEWGTVDGTSDDRFQFSLVADATIQLDLDWIGGADLDMLITDFPATAFQCGFVVATGAHPESGTCDLTAGDYIVRINSYDGVAADFRANISIVP